MKFRPCIDIHNGKVKQIVGSSLEDKSENAKENYISDNDAEYYADMYRKDRLDGGHIIMLNGKDSSYAEKNIKEAESALEAYPYGLEIGGGINDENAALWLENKASHVIVTSYVFNNGIIDMQRLDRLVRITGKEHLVLDLSCRRKNDSYYIVTDRWQKYTDIKICDETLRELSSYCDEFLVHAVDVEGKGTGIDTELLDILSEEIFIPVVYAGGISSYADIETIKHKGRGKIDFTVGSSLDIFGGKMSYKELCKIK